MSRSSNPMDPAGGPRSERFSVGKVALTTALITTGLTLSGVAAAERLPQASVEFERGELASAEGLASLRERVLRAAEHSCRQHGVRDLSRRSWERACQEEMTQELLVAIDSERLKRLHAQRAGGKSNDAG